MYAYYVAADRFFVHRFMFMYTKYFKSLFSSVFLKADDKKKWLNMDTQFIPKSTK